MAGYGDGPLSEAETAHLRQTAQAEHRAERWRMRWIGLVWVGMFGALAALFLDETLWISIPAGLLAALGVAAVILSETAIRPPERFGPAFAEGPLSDRQVGAGKMSERRFFVGEVPVAFPPHWIAAARARSPFLRVRGGAPMIADAAGVEQPMVGPMTPLQVLAIQDGPSVAFERERGLYPFPRLGHGWVYLALLLSIGVILGAAALSSAFSGSPALIQSLTAARGALAAPVQVADASALQGRAADGARIDVQAGWLLRARYLDGVERPSDFVVVGDAARARLLAERAPLDRARAPLWAAHQAALAEYRARLAAPKPQTPQAGAGTGATPSLFGAQSFQLRPPTAPLVDRAFIGAEEIVALLIADPRGGSVPPPAGARDPIVEDLAAARPFAGVALLGGGAAPLELYPLDLAEEYRLTGLWLLLGALCLLALMVIALAIWAAYGRQRRFRARVADAYRAAAVAL